MQLIQALGWFLLLQKLQYCTTHKGHFVCNERGEDKAVCDGEKTAAMGSEGTLSYSRCQAAVPAQGFSL